MSKTLRKVLHEPKYQNVNVKIGSKQGSSFWYCGKGDITYSLPAIQKVRNSMLRQNKTTLFQYEYRYKHLDQHYNEIYNNAKEKGRIKNLKNYLEKLNKMKERDKKVLPKKIESSQYDIETHLLDRPVQEIVKGISPDEQPCWVIYVKGMEKGAYWTIKEYNERRKCYEKENNDE